MSWLSEGIGDYERFLGQSFGRIAPFITGGSAANAFVQNEIVNKSDLRGAQIESFLSGLPLVGGLLKGVDGVQQLEDLYNNTGKVPAYAANNNSGASASGIGKSIPGIARKIEGGINDLFEFYTGEKDMTIEDLHRNGFMKYGDEL